MLLPSSPLAWGAGDPFRGFAWTTAASSTRHGQADVRALGAQWPRYDDDGDGNEMGMEFGGQFLCLPCTTHSATNWSARLAAVGTEIAAHRLWCLAAAAAELHRAAHGSLGTSRVPILVSACTHARSVCVGELRRRLVQHCSGPRLSLGAWALVVTSRDDRATVSKQDEGVFRKNKNTQTRGRDVLYVLYH